MDTSYNLLEQLVNSIITTTTIPNIELFFAKGIKQVDGKWNLVTLIEIIHQHVSMNIDDNKEKEKQLYQFYNLILEYLILCKILFFTLKLMWSSKIWFCSFTPRFETFNM